MAAVLPVEIPDLAREMHGIQSDLLHVGARLATSPDSPHLKDLQQIGERQIRALEGAIDRLNDELPLLRGFILPGGHISACWAHVARTTCRRAERHVVRLSSEYQGDHLSGVLWGVVTYLNRLSDYLFALARYCNRLADVPDSPWEK